MVLHGAEYFIYFKALHQQGEKWFNYIFQIPDSNWITAKLMYGSLRGKLTLLCSLALSSIKLECLKLVLEKLHNHVAFIYLKAAIFSFSPSYLWTFELFSPANVFFHWHNNKISVALDSIMMTPWQCSQASKLMSSVTLMHPKLTST